MSKFGLLGKNIDYSFSKSFFTEKFEKESLSHTYENFDIQSLENFHALIAENNTLKGLNVTIPYKEKIIPYLDGLDDTARKIGAVNVIKILQNNRLLGYNSDYFGFITALSVFLPLKRKTALILGTGGASKAIAFALDQLDFEYRYVSRTPVENSLSYTDLNKKLIEKYHLIVNCTPLGTSPRISDFPPIPYQFLTQNHLAFDLIYNPTETEFMKKAKFYGAKTCNGLIMLESQANKAWEIWNSQP